ncbi:MAG TPA: ATP-dependent metallopeptidase FtsH/Yme1/Tma family protein, partial [Candidatus Limnocylindrales bacterium]|nr:ATP-dependent metallopeptidase FtsH/Yme1/Tma family protein [Candidatus Limnocylindrales bacterium]
MNAKFFRNGILMLLLVVGTVALMYTWLVQSNQDPEVGYSEFLAQVQKGQVERVIQQDQALTVTAGAKTYQVIVPSVLTNVLADMREAAAAGGKTLPDTIYKAEEAPDTSWLGLILTGLLPLILIGGFIVFMMRQAQGTNNQAMSFGKSRARMFLG